MNLGPREKAEAFLKVAKSFRLGALPTEQRHPATGNLAELSRRDPGAALGILKKIDLGVLREVQAHEAELSGLESAIARAFSGGGRVFLYGCGATGRLSISVEYFWRLHQTDPAEADRVRGFMSGGDLALVHSIENFEDHPEWGARQLREIGFREGDLLICTSEGGETPSVIGCLEEALLHSSVAPYFLYCNPDSILIQEVERSRRVIENTAIKKICLFVGPMSLSGSTRLQATTALMLGVARALLAAGPDGAPEIESLLSFLEEADLSFLSPFVEEESRIYAAGDFVLYETNDYGITILTDTTERSPTFSLLGFENQTNPERKASLANLSMPLAKDSAEAWRHILKRPPLALEWPELNGIAGASRLAGFDFSVQARKQREALVAPRAMHVFRIRREGSAMVFRLNELEHRIDVAKLHPMLEHLFLKLLLNMHSTLVMGRMERFESNVMTWVKPSNNKLIDRAIRYVEFLLENEGAGGFTYEEIARQLFVEAEGLWGAESVVMKTVAALKKQRAAGA
ncbi:MAG: SIS domain-containing protein [Proteobacteria bacterium]|nr:MAG: SIS domain-containing protein [Pseudomonadota bacterium]